MGEQPHIRDAPEGAVTAGLLAEPVGLALPPADAVEPAGEVPKNAPPSLPDVGLRPPPPRAPLPVSRTRPPSSLPPIRSSAPPMELPRGRSLPPRPPAVEAPSEASPSPAPKAAGAPPLAGRASDSALDFGAVMGAARVSAPTPLAPVPSGPPAADRQRTPAWALLLLGLLLGAALVAAVLVFRKPSAVRPDSDAPTLAAPTPVVAEPEPEPEPEPEVAETEAAPEPEPAPRRRRRRRAATEPEPAPEPLPAPALPDTPSREEVVAALNGVRPALVACLDGRHGTVRVRVAVAGSGRVTTAQVLDSSFARAPTGSCVARAVRRARFPRFAQTRFVVVYPFQL